MIIGYPMFVYALRKDYATVHQYSVWTGYWLKLVAVLYASGGLGLIRIAIEPETLSAWSPGIGAWALWWIVITYFWLIAPIAYITGDAIIRFRQSVEI
jgi:hypothetical protein